MHGYSKNDHFTCEKVKPFHKNCPAAIGTAFSTKFVLETKVQNNAFWNRSSLGLCHSSVALSISFRSEWVFWGIDIRGECKYRAFKIFCKIVRACFFGGRLGARHQFQAFQGFLEISYNFIRSYVWSRFATCDATRTFTFC